MFKLGIESFIEEKKWQGRLENKQIALLSHQASVNQNLQSTLSLIKTHTPLKIGCILGPQHGFNSTLQANMITTENSSISFHNNENDIKTCPVFSLYSQKTRRLTTNMLKHFDVLIVDLQDVGCRVYTYLTTLFYILEDCQKAHKQVWILDRPNPVGRKIEGSLLNKNFMSFVGAAALPIQHGLTLAEAATWYCKKNNLNLDLEIIKMKHYDPQKNAWPNSLIWVLPSPNMTDPECARCYTGTVLLEGTYISEARGTTFPLKAFGFPNMKTQNILHSMIKQAPHWLKGCILKEEYFQPVFDKFKTQTCSGIRIYAQKDIYKKDLFCPYRLVSLFLKCVKKHHPDFNIISPPPYEYEYKKPPIDILSGDNFLRHWITNTDSCVNDLESKLAPDETLWEQQRKTSLLY